MSTGTHLRDVVVLDRDGTIVVDKDYLDDPAGLEFLPGAAEALRWLYSRGYRLVVVTNQSGIARGLFDLPTLARIHERLLQMVEQAGARLEGIYFCPHGPGDGCDCRKPRTALLLRAGAELGFSSDSVIVVGDKESDVLLGRAVGAPALLIRSDRQGGAAGSDSAAMAVVPDLAAAARAIADYNGSHGG